MNRKLLAKDLLLLAKEISGKEPLTEKEKQKFLDVIFTNTVQLTTAAVKFSDALMGLNDAIEQAKYFDLKDSKEISGRIKTVEKLQKMDFDGKLKQILKSLKGLEE